MKVRLRGWAAERTVCETSTVERMIGTQRGGVKEHRATRAGKEPIILVSLNVAVAGSVA
jgi:hypothetical protein